MIAVLRPSAAGTNVGAALPRPAIGDILTDVIADRLLSRPFRFGSSSRRLRLLLSTGAGFLLLFGTAFASQPLIAERERIIFRRTGVAVMAEKADTAERRARGLMYRTALGGNEAMLFYFEKSDHHAFWMRNTRIPLTVIFLDERLEIVDMQNMEPCLEKDAGRCPTYSSSRPARYAIEVNQGFVGRNGIKIGDSVAIEKEKGR